MSFAEASFGLSRNVEAGNNFTTKLLALPGVEIRHTRNLVFCTEAKLRIFWKLEARLRLAVGSLAYLSFVNFLEIVGLAVVGLFGVADWSEVVGVRDIRMMM